MRNKMTYRQRLVHKEQCECTDKVVLSSVVTLVALTSVIALSNLINNWEIITFIFGG